jgi:hypothetical protein
MRSHLTGTIKKVNMIGRSNGTRRRKQAMKCTAKTRLNEVLTTKETIQENNKKKWKACQEKFLQLA